ncbi:flagellar protein FlaG [compost metagenome]
MNGINRMELNNKEYTPSRTTSIPAPSSNLESEVDKKSFNSAFKYDNLSEEEKLKLERKLAELNEAIRSSEKMLRFKYNDKVKEVYVEVINRETQEVVTSLPPEFLIDLSIKMKEIIGLFIDKKL